MNMRLNHHWTLQTSSDRRCLRVTLFLGAFLLFAFTHVRAEDRIIIPALKITPGTTQQIAVQLINTEEYTAFEAEFYFPEGITPVKTSGGNYSVTLSSRKVDHSVSANIPADGGLKVVVTSGGNRSLKGNSGDLLYIDIASASTFKGPATIDVKGIRFTTATFPRKEIKFENTTCSLYTVEPKRGDANGDTVINMKDVVAIVNYLQGSPSASFDPIAADYNRDGLVTITDAVAVINYLLTN